MKAFYGNHALTLIVSFVTCKGKQNYQLKPDHAAVIMADDEEMDSDSSYNKRYAFFDLKANTLSKIGTDTLSLGNNRDDIIRISSRVNEFAKRYF
jgi:hypothetical protein